METKSTRSARRCVSATSTIATAWGLDGELDAHEWSDVGAYEFAPLVLASTGALG
jgi:hypothetical protein